MSEPILKQLQLLSEKATQKRWKIYNNNIISDEGDKEMCYYYRGKLICSAVNFNSKHGEIIMSADDAKFIVACVNYVKELLEQKQ